MDPTKEQWAEIAELCKAKSHIPFFDVAYQGFATGSLDEDAWAPRFFAEQGLEIMVCQSYSKNLGLYSERVGAINIVCEDKDTATRYVIFFLKWIITAMSSWQNSAYLLSSDDCVTIRIQIHCPTMYSCA